MSYVALRNGTMLFLVALLIRISYVYFFVELEHLSTEDQAMYIQLAKNFSNSGFLGMTTERVPGYPFFISIIYSLFGESAWNVIFIQSILDSITCIVIALMTKLLFNKGFWLAGVLSAINLNMIILSASLLTDTLFLFMFTLFLFSLFKYLHSEKISWLFLLILFLSTATLVRAASYYLLPFLLVSLIGLRLWHRDSILKIIKLISIFLIVVVTLLGGIHQRNYQQYDSMEFVSQTGTALLGWVIPATYQYSGQGSYQEGQAISSKKLDIALRRDNMNALPKDPFKNSAYQVDVGKEIFMEMEMVNIVKAWAVGAVINLFTPSVAFSPALRSMEHPSFYETKGVGVINKLLNYIKNSSGNFYLLILAIGTIISILFISLVAIGMFKMFLTFPPVIVATLIIIVGYFLLITGPIVGVKYRIPIEPLLTVFASYAIINSKFFVKNNLKKNSL